MIWMVETSSFRSLYSILLLERDVGKNEFGIRLPGALEPPALTLRHIETWLNTTKVGVIVWSYRGTGADGFEPADEKTTLPPTRVLVGVREGHVYWLMLDGLWSDLFGSSLNVAIKHTAPVHRRFRCIAETTEAKEELDGTDCESQSFLCFDYIVSAILAINVSGEGHQQETHKQTRGKKSSVSQDLIRATGDGSRRTHAPPARRRHLM